MEDEWKTKEPIEYQQTSGISETEHTAGGNHNSKTLFYKDCSLGSVKNLSNN